MDWLFELSAACVVAALTLPLIWKLLPPKLTLRPVRARAKMPAETTDQDGSF